MSRSPRPAAPWPTAAACLGSRPLAAALVACLLAGTGAGRGYAQDDAGLITWAKVESSKETTDFKEKIRGGGGIDAKAKEFLEQVALPQLALEGNRGTITSVRKRLREFLLNDIADEKIGDEANRIFATFMTALAAKEDEPPVVRVNAMLLVGELQTAGAAGRRPWPGGTTALAKAAADTALPKEVRIAAAAGLSRHFDSAKGNAELLGRMAKDAGPALVSIVKEMAAAPSGPENDWLLSRCLSMLALLGPAQPDAVAGVMLAFESPQRSFDARVRAATALAAIAGPQSNLTDPAGVIGKIESLSVACLQHDADAAELHRLEKLFSAEGGLGGAGAMAGGFASAPDAVVPAPAFDPVAPGGSGFPGGQMPQPPAEQLIPTEVCRRAAWRLASLANAIVTADEKRGLRTLVQDPAEQAKAKSLALNLRAAANALDTNPVDASLLQALADLKPVPPPAAESDGPAAEESEQRRDAAAPQPAAAANPAPAR